MQYPFPELRMSNDHATFFLSAGAIRTNIRRPLPTFMLGLLLWLIGTAASANTLSISADDTQLELAPYFQLHEDAGAALQIGDMSTARFAPASGQAVMNLGYSNSAWWLRLDVDAARARLWYLEIGYPSLDTVELYVPDDKLGYQRMVSGDSLPYSKRLLPHHNLLFPVNLPAGKSSLYLRVVSTGNLTIPATLWEPQAFQWHNQRSYALLSIYYGMLLALGLYNLLLYFSLRERVYLQYVLFLGGMAVGIASMNGLAGQFIWPDWARWTHYALPIGMASAGLFAAFFVRTFLDTRRNLPRLDLLFRLYIASYVVAILLNLVSYQAAEMLTSLASMLFSPTALVAGAISYRNGHAGARYFLLAWTALLMGSVSLAARNFGWLPTNFLTTHGFQVSSGLEMLLLSFALADRINTLRREKALADAKLLQAQEENVAALKISEVALEVQVAQRTRELAEANARLEALSRRDPLTGLGNRNELEDAWSKVVSRSVRNSRGVAALLLDLNDFKPINDTHGHEVGDHVLKEVATRLNSCVRASDTVVRLGGDEFVILLDDFGDGEEIDPIKDKIAAAIAEPIDLEGMRLVVGTSIGHAIYPADGSTLAALLRKADMSMYENKQRKVRSHQASQTVAGTEV